MTTFVHLEYSNQHSGVVRVEAAIESVSASARQIKRSFSTTHSLATLLLSAIAAAVIVVAYQVVQTMADGHLLALWIGMWAVAFVALAAFSRSARHLAVRTKAGLDSWSRNVAIKRADDRLWAMAKTDTRLMADLQAAISRGAGDDGGLRFVAPVNVVGTSA